jgi:DNA-3-methyladenine glycosylase II
MSNGNLDYARKALAHLRQADSVLAHIIDSVGPFQMVLRRERFQALCRAIIFQQLAGSAAHAIYTRFVSMFGRRFPTPRQVLDASPEDLRRAGLSRQKILYLKDLAEHVESGALNFGRFRRMEDEAIIAELTRVHGIGRWTAEMFLMFNLGRPDVLPVDDLGFRNAVRRLYRMRKMPDAKRLHALSRRWRPYRSAAVWYLWRSGDVVLPDGAPVRRIRTSEKARESTALSRRQTIAAPALRGRARRGDGRRRS